MLGEVPAEIMGLVLVFCGVSVLLVLSLWGAVLERIANANEQGLEDDVYEIIEAQKELEIIETKLWQYRLWVLSLTLREESRRRGKLRASRMPALVQIMRVFDSYEEDRYTLPLIGQIYGLAQEIEALKMQAAWLCEESGAKGLRAGVLIRRISNLGYYAALLPQRSELVRFVPMVEELGESLWELEVKCLNAEFKIEAQERELLKLSSS